MTSELDEASDTINAKDTEYSHSTQAHLKKIASLEVQGKATEEERGILEEQVAQLQSEVSTIQNQLLEQSRRVELKEREIISLKRFYAVHMYLNTCIHTYIHT